MRIKTLIIASFLLVGGCTTVSSNFIPISKTSKNTATTYIFYKCKEGVDEYWGGGQTGPSLYINDDFVGYLSANTYVPLSLPFGNHKIAFKGSWNFDYTPLAFSYKISDNTPKYLEFRVKTEDINALDYKLDHAGLLRTF